MRRLAMVRGLSINKRILLGVAAMALLAGSFGCGDDSPDSKVSPGPDGGALEWSYDLVQTSATIPPGTEYLGCERLPVTKPPSPRPTFLRSFDSNVDVGTHHMVLFFDDAPLPEGQRTCSRDPSPLWYTDLPRIGVGLAGVFDFAATAAKNPSSIATGVGPYSWSLPTGYGIFLSSSGDGQWVTNHHYLNLGTDPIEVGGRYTMRVTDYVDYPLARMFAGAGEGSIRVPPQSEGSTTGTLIAPYDVDVVVLGSHMHQHGLAFEMFFYDGESTEPEPFYTSTNWDSPLIVVLDEPMRLRKGQGITYKCTYQNPYDRDLEYLENEFIAGTVGAEMCSVWNYYAYPRGEGELGRIPPTLEGAVTSDGGSVEMVPGPVPASP